MFYLLEDNRIIDSKISYTANFPYWEIKDNCLFAKSKNDKLVRPCSRNQIKKQSENVYDLIDWEKDLIKANDTIYECRLLSDVRLEILRKNNYLIDAIYKPNEKGDYIKVWEVKKDES